MAILGGFGEVYVVSAAAGSIYLLFTLAMGASHGAGHGDGGHHGVAHGGGQAIGHGGHGSMGGGHAASGHGHAGPAAHSSGSVAHGHSGGHTGGATHSGGAGGHGGHGGTQTGHAGGQSGPEGGQSQGPGMAGKIAAGSHVHFPHVDGAHHAAPAGTDTGAMPVAPRFASRALQLAFTLLSPMTVASFLAFFGFAGLLIYPYFASFGALTLIPTVALGAFMTRIALNLLSFILAKLEGRGVASMTDLIGLIGTVTVSVEPGFVGQITYVIHGKRERCRARGLDGKATFRRGSRVMISDIVGGVAYVEPWTDNFLPDSDASEVFMVEDQLKQQEQ